MQKKFWSALLSLAMIVSCFSGVTLASGGQDKGLPSQQMSAPSNVNIDMFDSSRITVQVPYNGSVTLTGTVMAQGTESPTQRMDTTRVNALYYSLTGQTGNNESLLIGEVVNGNPLFANTLNPTAFAHVSPTWSAGYNYLAKEFVRESTNVPRLWAVGSDGSYSITFIPDVHTTKYYGFALSSLYGAINSVNSSSYGVFESVASSSGGVAELAAYNAANDVLTVYNKAYDDVQAAVNAYLLKIHDLKARKEAIDGKLDILEASANIVKADILGLVSGVYGDYTVPAKAEWDGSDAAAMKTRLYNEAKALEAEMSALYVKLLEQASSNYNLALFLNTQSELSAIYNGLAATSLNALSGNALTSAQTAYASINTLANDLGLKNYNASGVDYYTIFNGARSALGDASAAVNIAANAIQNQVYLTHDGSESNFEDTVTTLGTDLNNIGLASAGTAAYDTGTDLEVDPQLATTMNALQLAKDDISSYVAGLYADYQNAVGNAANAKTARDRYIQNTPLTVRYMYKLSGSAVTYPAGTSGNHVISGTVVTSDDQTIPYDFSYVVYAGDIADHGTTSQMVASGRTQNGYFSFTMNTMFNDEVYLYPTERYAREGSSGSSYSYITLDPVNKPSERFPYTVAVPQRSAFIKAELDESTMTSSIIQQPIKFTDLYTYNEADSYDVIAAAPTGFTDKTNIRLYGVSYVAYNAAGQQLGKSYSIKDNYDVTYSWKWGGSQTLIDSTSVTGTPTFRLNNEGYLTYEGEVAYFTFTSSGNASLRVRQTGRTSGGTSLEKAELYQSILTIAVEAPGQVTTVAGNELKKIDVVNKDPHIIQLHSLTTTAIDSIRMSKISYDDKPDVTHNLEKKDTYDAAKAAAKGHTLTYYIDGNEMYVFMPWDMVTQGGSNVEITCDFLDAKGYLVTSRVVTIKNSLWKAVSEQMVLTVQAANTFDAIVTNGDDVEQNSAMLKLLDDNNPSITSPLARSAIRNIVGGRYTFNNARPMAGGDVYLVVQETTADTSDVKAMVTLQALGLNDIDTVLTEGKDTVVTGLAKTLEFTATNAAGSAETGLVNAQLYSLDGVTKNTNFANYDSLKLVHTGGGKYTISLVNLKPGSYILRVSTMNMTHYADIEFEALPLTIQYPDEFGILTWDTTIMKNSNFYDANKMEFTVIDPMTDKEVYVQIKDDVVFVTEDGEESEMGTVMRAYQSGNSGALNTTYDWNLSLSDKDFLPYNYQHNRTTHEFWVGLVDDRSDVVRAAEGDLSLKFNFIVQENNSTGEKHDVEGMVIPIGLPTLEVNPTAVNRNTTTTVTLTVKDANGRPASGVQIRPDVEAVIAARTNADGETQYLFTPMVTGNTKRFDIAGFEGSAQVYAILNIVDDSEVPVIALNPYISKTAKDAVEISGIVSDNLGLQLFTVDNTMVNMTLTGKTSYEFAFTVSLRVGENKIRMVVQDNSGQFTEKTITIIRNMPSVVIMTLGSTEVIGATGLDVEPVVSNGRTMLPIRFIFQDILGGEVVFDAATQTITADVMGHNIVMTVGSNEARVDGAKVTLLTAPYIVEEAGRTLAPIREILEAIGVKVDFEPTALTVTVTGGGDVDEYTDTDLIAPAGATVGNTDEEVIDETEEIDQTDETEEIDETEEVDETDETEEGDDEDAEGTVG